MATYIYARVSTGGQTFEQQMQTVKEHFRKMKSDISSADGIVEEHVSGAVEWQQRKLKVLVNKCKPGDTIFVSELSRLGRNQADIFSLVEYAVKREVELFICKDNMPLENRTMGGKMFLFVLSMQAEAERTNTVERNKARAAWEREQIAKNGGFISKSGKWVTRQGRPKRDPNNPGDYNLNGIEAAAAAKQDEAIRWREQSKGYSWVRAQVAKGKTRALIIEEFNELHAADPENYSTREGKPLSKGVLSRWCREMNPLAV